MIDKKLVQYLERKPNQPLPGPLCITLHRGRIVEGGKPTVVHNCHGKRNNLTANELTSWQKKKNNYLTAKEITSREKE